MSSTDPEQGYFFIHVMKTGGFSLASMIARDVFTDPRQRFPGSVKNRTDRTQQVRMKYGELRRAIEERGHEIRIFGAHYPYAVVRYMKPDVKTFALFRNPIDRGISHFQHVNRRPFFSSCTMEELYADQRVFRRNFDNFQLRMFAVSDVDRDDGSIYDHVELTEADVDRALQRVEKLDVIGLTERFDEFAAMLQAEFGWRFRNVLRVNRSNAVAIEADFRARIGRDLALDRKFYEGVCEIYNGRRRILLQKHGGERMLSVLVDGA